MKQLFKMIPDIVKELKSNYTVDAPRTILRVLSRNVGDSFSEELQRAFKAFSTQGFLATPVPVNVITERSGDRRLFTWEAATLIRNVGSQFQTVQVSTAELYIQYLFTGGLTESIPPTKEGATTLLAQFSTAKEFINSLILLSKEV